MHAYGNWEIATPQAKRIEHVLNRGATPDRYYTPFCLAPAGPESEAPLLADLRRGRPMSQLPVIGDVAH